MLCLQSQGCNYKLNQDIHWIINRILLNGGNFSGFPINYSKPLLDCCDHLLQRLLFIPNVNTTTSHFINSLIHSFIHHFPGKYYVLYMVLKAKDSHSACFPSNLECGVCSKVRCWAEEGQEKDRQIHQQFIIELSTCSDDKDENRILWKHRRKF